MSDDSGDAAHQVADQAAVARLLADPATHGLSGGEEVQRLDTHASMVFLAGERAYKVKRAVEFPYMDFSTLDKRRAACATELARNRRTAPELYLGVCPVVRGAEGELSLGEMQPQGPEPETGDVVEWAVVMQRFPQEALLSHLAEAGKLDAATVDALARAVAAFHEAAEPVSGGGAQALGWVIDENAAEFPESPELFDPESAAQLTEASRRALEDLRALLDRRAAGGLVRRCHGDLHLRNVVLLDGAPRLFDAVEFNDAIACIDVLYDLAFLLMDLDRRGLDWAANRVLNRYLQHRDDLEGLAAMPLFLSLRAAIRAKVGASALAAHSDADRREALRAEIADYFAAARAYLDPAPPALVAVGGVSGTGKTTVARQLAPGLGAAPGALLFRSDVERKRIFGVAEEERLPESAYQGRINARVYEQMLERARRGLAAGRAVIVEATFLRREDRATVRKLAEAAGVPFCGLWLTAPRETLMGRVAAREGDASDATPAVVAGQLERAPGEGIAWPAVDASGAPDAVAARARAVLTKTLSEAG